jgi:subtilisin-like proprotein convertase family protein
VSGYGATDYTSTFGGTSAATPIAAGVVALMLQANPNLGWRDVQAILLKSARVVDPDDPGWTINPAGFRHNHRYGAGLVDAEAAVALAQTWTNLPVTQVVVSRATNNVNRWIPDNNVTGLVLPLDFCQTNLVVEHVQVKVNVTHTWRGHLALTLISPSGVESRLAEQRPGDNNVNLVDWTFTSVRHWGEQAQGVWNLRIADLATDDTGRVNQVTVTLRGTQPGRLVNAPPTFGPLGMRRLTLGARETMAVEAMDNVDGDAVTLSLTQAPRQLRAMLAETTAVRRVVGALQFAAFEAGVYTVTIQATDRNGTRTLSVPVEVVPRKVLSQENFGAGLPAGWSSLSSSSPKAYWSFTDPGGRGNLTGGTGGFAIADSYYSSNVVMNAELRTKKLDFRNFVSGQVRFLTAFRIKSGKETADVDMSLNGGTSWVNLWKRQVAVREPVAIDIPSSVVGNTNVVFRFHYYSSVKNERWWQVDDVEIVGWDANDSDADGLPNWWERLYTNSAVAISATADGDGDGCSNYAEFMAGTDPGNGLSRLVCTHVETGMAGSVDVEWASESGRLYDLERSTNLALGFSAVATNLTANPPVNRETDGTATNAVPYFYRVRVR